MNSVSTCKHPKCGKMRVHKATLGLLSDISTFLRCNRLRLSLSRTFVLSLLAVIAQSAVADNPFSPGSADYKVVGSLVGDQINAQLSLSTNGGYLVWQDNAADIDGFGIRAQRIDTSMQKVGPIFRVNSVTAGEQENPQVVRLNDGGAAFFWQGGMVGFQKIYSRFIGATGTNFLSTDIMVNTYTNESQTCPSAAKLADGNVVVVWCSQGQGGQYQGVFGQLFSPSGIKVGSEFGVSQNAAYNHRSPAVAALPSGGFVATWITELQRSSSSIDTVVRMFTPSGSPVAPSVFVNVANSGVCANPAVAGRAQGGFTVAWSQKNAVLYNQPVSRGGSVSPTGWDVQVASYKVDGSLALAPVTVNTVTAGDQYAPKLAAFGKSSLIIWNSFAQDGSWEGVYGQFLEQEGTFTGVEFPINTIKVSRQLAPCISTDGVSRFLVCWSSFGAGAESFEVWGRYYDLISVEITPVAGGVQISWNSYPGASYLVQQRSDQTGWSNMQTVSQVAGYRTTVNAPLQGGAVFYRVIRTN
jgi:hypothetical protein